MKIYELKEPLPEFIFEQQPDGNCGLHDEFYLGSNSTLLKNQYLAKYLPEVATKYRYFKNVGVKIQGIRPGHKPVDLDQLIERTKIQNIFSFCRMAPRIYDLIYVKIGRFNYLAQVTEEVKGEVCWDKVTMNQVYELADLIAKKFWIKPFEDYWRSNIRGDKIVDFDNFIFKDFRAYKKYLTKKVDDHAVTKTGGGSYQRFETLGLNTGRTINERLKKFGLDKLDLSGKTVLELGCSAGAVLHYLSRHNSPDYLVGVDYSEVAEVARELANFLGCFNIDFYGYSLTEDSFEQRIKELTGIEKFDVIIMFSVNHHIGFHQYMYNLAGGEVYIECNNAKSPEEEKKLYPQELRKLGFKEFSWHGLINEAGQRLLLKTKV